MSDFNTMFSEQVAIEESAGVTQRILEEHKAAFLELAK